MAGEPRQPAVELAPGQIAFVLSKAYKRQVNWPTDSIWSFFQAYKQLAAGTWRPG